LPKTGYEQPAFSCLTVPESSLDRAIPSLVAAGHPALGATGSRSGWPLGNGGDDTGVFPGGAHLTLEQRDRFHVRGVREHVHHASRFQPESVHAHQRAGIARQ